MNMDSRSALPALLLTTLLLAAVVTDVRARRISNLLVLAGLAAALALQAVVVPGAGLFSVPFGAIGLLSSLGGALLGLALLLPIYALGAMGAGDVKLMAMVGAFIGPQEIIGATLATLLAGGVLALAFSIKQRTLRRVLGNVKHMMFGGFLRLISGGGARIDAPATATGQLPYAIAIATGTLGYIAFSRIA